MRKDDRNLYSLAGELLRGFLGTTRLVTIALCVVTTLNSKTAQAEIARGVIFHDQNGNGQREENEPGIPDIRVSNGLDIVRTDTGGNYQLPVDDDTMLFVLKPRNWQSPVNEQNLPQFYYNHKPAGSPDENYDYPGVEPTGPLPSSIDFPLKRIEESEVFSVILMGDPQPTTRQQVRYYANDLIAELVDSKVAFGISLGDIVGNDLSLFENVNAAQSKVGVPWHNVLGNHDINFHSPDDKHSDETFERVFGPMNYAFQWAAVHFIVLDNVRWKGIIDQDNNGRPDQGNYVGAFSDDQLQFVANYVAEVPVNECLVICTHIPLTNPSGPKHGTRKLSKLLKILAKHPHQVSFSAHTHYIRQDFVGGPEDQYFDHHADGEDHHHHHFQLHHHHNTATGSGSWFRGPKDEQGIPMTPMRDGVPNGYLIATFTGSNYKLRYKAARQPKDYQMSIHAPETTFVSETSKTEILVNVFNGNEKTKVRMRVRGIGDWIAMTRTEREDPGYRAMYERDLAYEKRPHTLLPDPVPTPHIWVAKLPAGMEPDTHVLEVISTDMFGQIDRGIRLIEVDADPQPVEAENSGSQEKNN